MSPKTLVIAFIAFAAPVGFILINNRSEIDEETNSAPKVGHVLYFTAPG